MDSISASLPRTKWLELSYPQSLALLYAVLFAVTAINPVDRADWAMEQSLALLLVALLAFTYRTHPLSNVSYSLIFAYLFLHCFGAHYTYAQVPFGFWLQDTFHLSRNIYDRIVHTGSGLLFAQPMREMYTRLLKKDGWAQYWLPIELTLALGAVYEIVEMIAAQLTAPQLVSAFLGSQGDVWDAQYDMLCAGAGAAAAMAVAAVIEWKRRRNI
jgi:putative membrane protein